MAWLAVATAGVAALRGDAVGSATASSSISTSPKLSDAIRSLSFNDREDVSRADDDNTNDGNVEVVEVVVLGIDGAATGVNVEVVEVDVEVGEADVLGIDGTAIGVNVEVVEVDVEAVEVNVLGIDGAAIGGNVEVGEADVLGIDGTATGVNVEVGEAALAVGRSRREAIGSSHTMIVCSIWRMISLALCWFGVGVPSSTALARLENLSRCVSE
mgnify:CR=1 FL=1